MTARNCCERQSSVFWLRLFWEQRRESQPVTGKSEISPVGTNRRASLLIPTHLLTACHNGELVFLCFTFGADTVDLMLNLPQSVRANGVVTAGLGFGFTACATGLALWATVRFSTLAAGLGVLRFFNSGFSASMSARARLRLQNYERG